MKPLVPLSMNRAGLAFAALLTILFLAPLALANPAMQFNKTLTQPDGTQLDVRLWGDEFANGWETADGYTIRLAGAAGEPAAASERDLRRLPRAGRGCRSRLCPRADGLHHPRR